MSRYRPGSMWVAMMVFVLLIVVPALSAEACGCSQPAEGGAPAKGGCGGGSGGGCGSQAAPAAAAKPAGDSGKTASDPVPAAAIRDGETVHVLLSAQSKAISTVATGVLWVPNPPAGQGGTVVTLQKRVPKAVQLTDFKVMPDAGMPEGSPLARVAVKESADGEGRLYVLTVEGLPEAAADTGKPAADCCGGGGSGQATGITYAVQNLSLNSEVPTVSLGVSPRRVKAGRPVSLLLTARVQVPPGVSGAGEFHIPSVLAGSLTTFVGASEGARTFSRPPTTVLAWPISGGAEAGETVFTCTIGLTPVTAGEIALENAFEVRLAAPGLSPAQMIPPGAAEAGQVPGRRLLVLHAPLVLHVRSR